MTDDSEKSPMDYFRQGRREAKEALQNTQSPQPTFEISIDELEKLVQQAKSDTVTVERLLGEEQYFYNVIPFLEEQEQPHFLFPLTRGLFADPALVVESGAARDELLGKNDGGTVALTDRYVRIHSDKGEWTIPYSSVASVDFVGHPALHIQTVGRTYYIKIAGTFFDEEQNLSDAANYIRQKQQAAEEGRSESSASESTDPLERLEKLNSLKEAGAITEDEFEEKKQDLLDEV